MSSGIKQDISIGGNLQRLRNAAGFSQEKAAAQLQLMGLTITREILSKMEQGRYSVKISVLLALKQLYKVDSFDEFFEGLSL